MLDGLDAVDFAALEDAYGPAAGVPATLRALIEDLPTAHRALERLVAGIYHQGSYFSATAPATRFLVELAGLSLPAQGSILLLLAEMSAGHLMSTEAWNPYAFPSDPAPPTYPEAVATIEQIRLGIPIYEQALESPRAEVRSSAAYLLAGLDACTSTPSIEQAWTAESDEWVRTTLAMTLRRLQRPAPARTDQSVESDVLVALDVLAGRAEQGCVEALERLARHPSVDATRMPFANGNLCGIAVAAMEALDTRFSSEALEALWRVMNDRLAQGQRVHLPQAPMQSYVDGGSDPPQPSALEWEHDGALRAIAAAIARRSIPSPSQPGRYLRREQMDDRARRCAQLTVDHRIALPVPALPWIEPRTMARFLSGDGPLDEVLEVGGVRAPAFEHLHFLPLNRDPDRQVRLAAFVEAVLDDNLLFALMTDAIDGAYPFPSGVPMGWMVVRELVPLCAHRLLPLAGRFQHYRGILAQRSVVPREAAWFALLPEIHAKSAVDAKWDRLVSSALCMDPEKERDWLGAFEEPRRSKLVAAIGNAWILRHLGPCCEGVILSDAIIEAFLDPACHWLSHDAERLLVSAGNAERLTALVDGLEGRKRGALRRAIAELTRQGFYGLELTTHVEGIAAVLRDGQGRQMVERLLPAVPTSSDYAWVAEAVAGTDRPVIELRGDIGRTLIYQAQMHLSEWVRGEIRM